MQSISAARAAPPPEPKPASQFVLILGFVVAVLLGLGFCANDQVGAGLLVGLVIFVLAATWQTRRDKKAKERQMPEYTRKRAEWERSVMCMRCGEITAAPAR